MNKGDAENALKEYRESAAFGDDTLKAKSFYNMGNALYEGQKFGEAASAFKEVLKHDPSDRDAKINLEMALKKMEEQKQQQQDKDGGDKEEEKENKDEKKGCDDKDDKGDRAEKNDEQSQKDRREKSGDEASSQMKKEEKKEMSKEEEKEMSKEEAERLLENLGDQNMDLQNMADMLKNSNPSRVEKDW